MQNLAVTLFLVLSFGTPVLATSISTTDKGKGDRTMTKVVKMLQDMIEKSQADGEKDRTLYAEFKCYCVDNEKDKTHAIEETKEEIKIVENEIAKIMAHTGELSSECAQLKVDIADNEDARATAKEQREKAEKEFIAEEEDMVEAIDAMTQAIDTLAAVGADQTSGEASEDHKRFMGKGGKFLEVKASLKQAMAKVSVLLSPKEKQKMDSFLQAPFTGTYTSQSGEIVGILKNMKDTFKNNLGSIRSAEAAAKKAHVAFMETKENEHTTLTEMYEKKQGMLGENDDSLASAREELEELQAMLASDEEFLAKLIPMCEAKAKEFAKRNQLRAQEEAAISEAIAILNSDAAFEAFGKVSATKSGATSFFLQIRKHNNQASTRKQALLKLLGGLARKQKSLKLARIVALIDAENPFATVLKEIEKMIALIEAEEKDDKKNLDWCKNETEVFEGKKSDAESQILDLKSAIQKLDDSINNPETGFIAMIKQNEDNLKKNHDNMVDTTTQRADENRAYQTSIKNIVAAEELLKKAITVLKKYYAQFEKKEEESFTQKEDPEPPETWESEEEQGGYAGQREAGGEVIDMLKFIAKETQKEEDDAHSAEEEAQHAFEDEMEELKKEEAELQKTIADLRVELADAEKTLGERKTDLANTQEELKKIEQYLLDIKPGCDFITENYDTRKKNRETEKKALEEAMGMIKDTPAYAAAEAAIAQEALGDCKDICNEAGTEHAKCKACLAGVSVPGYCAGHADTEGC